MSEGQAGDRKRPPLTDSERIFELFCSLHGIGCVPVPVGPERTHDYLLTFGTYEVKAEVKETQPNKEELENERLAAERGYGNAMPLKPGQKVRQMIKSASKQFGSDNARPALLVLFDQGREIGHVDADQIRMAMYGLEQIYLTVPPPGTEGHPYFSGSGYGPGRAMTRETSTRISAIGHLFMTDPNSPRLRVYHNEFARVPLSEEVLRAHELPQFRLAKAPLGSIAGWEQL